MLYIDDFFNEISMYEVLSKRELIVNIYILMKNFSLIYQIQKTISEFLADICNFTHHTKLNGVE